MMFKTRPVLATRPNWGEIDAGWIDNVTVQQSSFGKSTLWKLEQFTRRTGTIPFTFFDRNEIIAFTDFIQSTSGRLRGFWVPTWAGDLIPAEPISGNTILIEDCGLAAAFGTHPGIKYLAIHDRFNIECVEIESVETTGEGELITLTAPIVAEFSAKLTNISWLFYARLADDTVDFSYTTDDCASVKAKIVELPDEYAAVELAFRPAYLYKFVRGNSTFALTSFANSIVLDTQTYTPEDLNHGEITRNSDFVDEGLALEWTTNDENNPFREWIAAAPAIPTTLTLTEYWFEGGTTKVIYVADIEDVTFDKGGKIQITLSTLFRLGDCKFPVFFIGRACNNYLFQKRCGLSEAAFILGTTATYDAIERSLSSALFTTMNAVYSNWFTGGKVMVGEQILGIKNHIGSKVYLTSAINGANDGDLIGITITPGCDRQFTTCKLKFNNTINFTGFPFWPTQNPQLTALSLTPSEQNTKKG